MRRMAALAGTFALIWLMVATPVEAAGLTLLRSPAAPSGVSNVHWGHCAASGFKADGAISGVCQYSYGSAQRFHSSPTNSYWMTWAADGSIIGLGAQCGHSTGYRTGNWADPGCGLHYQGTGTVVMIDGVPYYDVATDPLTGHRLASSNAASYLAT